MSDLGILMLAGYDGLREGLACGMRRGHHDEWRQQTISAHLRHIEAHINTYQWGDRDEDHLACIVAHAAMIYAINNGTSLRADQKTTGIS